MKTLYVVRHGDTFPPGTAPRRIGSRTDLPLTGLGEARAGAVAGWFTGQGIRIDACVSGPLLRARRTADLIRSSLAVPPPLSVAAWLDEIDHGPDEDKPESEVVERVGHDALDRWNRLGKPPPDWPVDVPRRMEACREAVGALRSGSTLLVTSNGAARFILLALGLGHGLPSMKLRTGAIGEVAIRDNGAVLRRWDLRP